MSDYKAPEIRVIITKHLHITALSLGGSTGDYSYNNGNFETPVWDDEETY